MQTLTQYTDDKYINGQINEGFLDWFINLFKRTDYNIERATKRNLLPAKNVSLNNIKQTVKAIEGTSAIKKTINSNKDAYPETYQILSKMKNWTDKDGNSIDEKKTRWVTYVYRPDYAFKGESYICAVGAYTIEPVIDENTVHIITFEGAKNVVDNWDNLKNDLFKQFVERIMKDIASHGGKGDKTKLSMYYINNTNNLPQYNGHRFSAMEDNKNPIAIVEIK